MGNRQAESAATKLAGWRRIHLMKLLEQARLLFGRQPDAGIGDVEANPPWTRHLHGETDFSGWRELHRIAEQVQIGTGSPSVRATARCRYRRRRSESTLDETLARRDGLLRMA